MKNRGCVSSCDDVPEVHEKVLGIVARGKNLGDSHLGVQPAVLDKQLAVQESTGLQ